MRQWLPAVLLAAVVVLSTCASVPAQTAAPPATTTSTLATTAAPAPTTSSVAERSTSTSTSTATSTAPTTTTLAGMRRPSWLGTRELTLREGEDNGVAEPTPPELVDRQLWSIDHLQRPESAAFTSTLVSPPPAEVLSRSTWRPECPVAINDLSYATVTFFGFDGVAHTGEFILHNDFAAAVVNIFESMYEMRFPIEEMRVTSQADVDAHPTGDSNNTSSFVCRPAVNSGTWSRHAWGGAIDINPFHNPYVKGDLVIPELASAYLDRDRVVPGMVTEEVRGLFAEIGWGWGGAWRSASDWMHFSDTGT